MKLASATLLAVLLLSVVGASDHVPAPVTIRVLTYNIRHGEGRDGQLDLARIAVVMKSVEPDIIALQEVDHLTERSGGVDQLAELARRMDMHAEFGWALNHSGGGYGVAVMSRWPLEAPDNRPLPASPEREPRTALTVGVRAGIEGPLLQFTSTHLDSGRRSPDRLDQALYLNELLVTEERRPSILAGDFNARPDNEVMQVFEAHWTNPASSFASPSPRRRRGPRGDYVLFRPAESWRVLETRVVDERVASDHRPLLIVFEWVG